MVCIKNINETIIKRNQSLKSKNTTKLHGGSLSAPAVHPFRVEEHVLHSPKSKW
jgi:hypothetical protein